MLFVGEHEAGVFSFASSQVLVDWQQLEDMMEVVL